MAYKAEHGAVIERGSYRTVTRVVGGLALVGALIVGCGGSTKKNIEQPPTIASTSLVGNPIAGSSVLLEGSHHTEIQQFGAPTFTDYTDASGLGARLEVGFQVDVDCLATGPIEAAPSVKGKWYHIIGPEPFVGRFAAANTFENGDTTGPLSEQPAVDPNVPPCPV